MVTCQEYGVGALMTKSIGIPDCGPAVEHPTSTHNGVGVKGLAAIGLSRYPSALTPSLAQALRIVHRLGVVHPMLRDADPHAVIMDL